MTEKTLVCSVSMKDLEIQTFRAGGKGGQHQNKTSSAVRLIHKPSGAVGLSREHRSQEQNKKAALRRLAETEAFRTWAKIRAGISLDIEVAVDQAMRPENLKVEVGGSGRWEAE